MKNLFRMAKACLLESHLERKIQLSFQAAKYKHEDYDLLPMPDWTEPEVGRPCKPRLVLPQTLPRRGFGTKQGRLCLLHAIAHIEFNAINLAWDAIYRFQKMPEDYYWDWLKVAREETEHFVLLRKHLQDADHDYGDFDAHDGLWSMAENTAHDVLHRMAIIPRVLEARGLDVTPAMINKFSNIGENEIASSLETIYQQEIGHVRTGNKWYEYLCRNRQLHPQDTFIELLRHYQLDEFHGEINREARAEAGFSQQELNELENNYRRSAHG